MAWLRRPPFPLSRLWAGLTFPRWGKEQELSPSPDGSEDSERIHRFGLRRKILLAVLLAGMLVLRVDTFYVAPARSAAWVHVFSLGQWELGNLHRKWVHLLWEALPGNTPTREERLSIVDDYLRLARMAKKEKDRLEGRSFARSATLAIATKERAASEEYLNELLDEKRKVRPLAEEAVEAELSSVLAREGMGSRLGLLFPPVDIKFERPPAVIVTSPRDRIQLLEVVLLEPDIKGLERDRIEKKVLRDHNLSALVDNLAGLATYPTLVSDLDTLRGALQTAAHEWLHAYWVFRPLGRYYWRSAQMSTLNETAADLAGREIGDMTFALMGGDLSVSARRYLSGEERDPRLARELRETRARTEELLAEGGVEEAEQYMKERWWRLRLAGYGFRKLNQAYFAFRGRYGESAASVSPIGDQMKELRGLFPDAGTFVRTVAGVGSYREFLALLGERRAMAFE